MSSRVKRVQFIRAFSERWLRHRRHVHTRDLAVALGRSAGQVSWRRAQNREFGERLDVLDQAIASASPRRE